MINDLARETIYVPANKLCIKWNRAQRTIDPSWVQLIIENWNRDLFDDLLVAGPDENDRYHVVEGMHRHEVVTKLFGELVQVPCRIVTANSSPEAARIWALINRSKKAAKQVELFDILVEGENVQSSHIKDILTKFGLHVARANVLGGITAVGALNRVYKITSKTHPAVGMILTDTLSLLVSAWGHNPKAYSSLMLRGMAIFVRSFPAARHSRVIEVMKLSTPGDLAARSKTRLTRNSAHIICEELVMQYNYKLQDSSRLKLDSIVS